METPPEELQHFGVFQTLKEAVSIPRHSCRTFSLLTLTLVLPLSSAILFHSLIADTIIHFYTTDTANSEAKKLIVYFLYDFLYILFLLTFSLFSTGATVFSVASLYTSKPTSFASSLSALPLAFRRLFITFLWISLLMILYYPILIFAIVALLLLISSLKSFAFVAIFFIALSFCVAHVYITALWHLASVITVLEPVQGLAAMKKSYHLLRDKTWHAASLVLLYFALCASVSVAFGLVVVSGHHKNWLWLRILVGGLSLVVLVVVNLAGLLVQSVFYYVCKSYHNQAIDKTVLHEHLGGYLGEYVPLKSNIQIENVNQA